jgi:hypothetical protein
MKWRNKLSLIWRKSGIIHNGLGDPYGPETYEQYAELRRVFYSSDFLAHPEKIPPLIPILIYYPLTLTAFALTHHSTYEHFEFVCRLVRVNFSIELQMRWVIGSLIRIHLLYQFWLIDHLRRVFTDECFQWLFNDENLSGANKGIFVEMYANIILTERLRLFEFYGEPVEEMGLSPTVKHVIKGFLYNNSTRLSDERERFNEWRGEIRGEWQSE